MIILGKVEEVNRILIFILQILNILDVLIDVIHNIQTILNGSRLLVLRFHFALKKFHLQVKQEFVRNSLV